MVQLLLMQNLPTSASFLPNILAATIPGFCGIDTLATTDTLNGSFRFDRIATLASYSSTRRTLLVLSPAPSPAYQPARSATASAAVISTVRPELALHVHQNRRHEVSAKVYDHARYEVAVHVRQAASRDVREGRKIKKLAGKIALLLARARQGIKHMTRSLHCTAVENMWIILCTTYQICKYFKGQVSWQNMITNKYLGYVVPTLYQQAIIILRGDIVSSRAAIFLLLYGLHLKKVKRFLAIDKL